MKNGSKKKILLLVIFILLIVIAALFYRLNYKTVELKYNSITYHEWSYKPNTKLLRKYWEFTNGNYAMSDIYKEETSYNSFINEYQLEELQLIHDFDNYNYVIVMFYIGYGDVSFDNQFNFKDKLLKFTSNNFRNQDYYIADAFDNYYKIFEIELPKNIDDVSIKYTLSDNNKNQITT